MTVLVPAHSPSSTGKPAGRIRQKNEETILAAAEEEFAKHGFKGTSMNTIALRAACPRPTCTTTSATSWASTWRC